MKIIKYLSVILSLSLLSGCGTARYIVPEVKGDSCKVYVFRDSFHLVWSLTVDVKTDTYAKLNDKTYTHFKLPVGEHIVEANWAPGSGGVDLDVPLTCKVNETAYIVFFGTYDGYYRTIKGGYLSKEQAEEKMRTHKLAGTE